MEQNQPSGHVPSGSQTDKNLWHTRVITDTDLNIRKTPAGESTGYHAYAKDLDGNSIFLMDLNAFIIKYGIR